MIDDIVPSQETHIKRERCVDGMKRIWDNYAVVGGLQKSPRQKFVFGAGVRDGIKYINIREFYYSKKRQEWRPGRDGITVPIVYPLELNTKQLKPWEMFIALFLKTADQLETMELYDEDNSVYMMVKENKIIYGPKTTLIGFSNGVNCNSTADCPGRNAEGNQE
jgi:hypothetical protein